MKQSIKQTITTAIVFFHLISQSSQRSVPGPPQKTRRSETKEGLLASFQHFFGSFCFFGVQVGCFSNASCHLKVMWSHHFAWNKPERCWWSCMKQPLLCNGSQACLSRLIHEIHECEAYLQEIWTRSRGFPFMSIPHWATKLDFGWFAWFGKHQRKAFARQSGHTLFDFRWFSALRRCETQPSERATSSSSSGSWWAAWTTKLGAHWHSLYFHVILFQINQTLLAY